MSEANADLPEIPAAERRRTPRRVCRGAVFCRVVADNGPLLRGDLVDVSRGGACLVLPSWMPVNQDVEVGFASLERLGLLVRANVRNTATLDDHHWRIGCEFGQPLTDEELNDVIAEILSHEDTEENLEG